MPKIMQHKLTICPNRTAILFSMLTNCLSLFVVCVFSFFSFFMFAPVSALLPKVFENAFP